jgi:hypothetical protein
MVAKQAPAAPRVTNTLLQCNNRIDQDDEVGPRARALDKVSGMWIARIVVRRQPRSELTTRRKAEHANSLRIDPPCFGPCPNRPNRPRRIQQLRRMAHIWV